MRINDEQFLQFTHVMRKTLTVSIRIEKVDALNFRCIISLHNPTYSDFDFLYVVEEMDWCYFLTPFGKEGNALEQVFKFGGRLTFGRVSRNILATFKDWDVAPIAAGGVQYFEIPIWIEEGVLWEQSGKLLRVGKKTLFWMGGETKLDMLFWYYKLTSEFVSLPLEPQPDDKPNATE